MRNSDRYVKVVQWSEEDGCYIGLAPALMYGGCDGDDQGEVFRELCEIVEEVVDMYLEIGAPLPPSDIGLNVDEMIREHLRELKRQQAAQPRSPIPARVIRETNDAAQ